MILARITGFIAFILIIYAIVRKKRSQILITKMVSLIFWSIHFALLGAHVGMAMNSIGVIKEYVLEKRTKHAWADSKYIPAAFIIVNIIAAAITWNAWYSILPVTGAIFSTLSSWQKKELHLRLLLLVQRPLWFSYNWIVGSYAGMATEIALTITIIFAIYKHDLQKSRVALE